MSKLGRFTFVFILIFITMHGYRLFLNVTSMGDEANLSSKLDDTVNYVFGLPMVLVNNKYPFKLGSSDFATIEFILISILNTALQTIFILGLFFYVKKLKPKFK